MQCMDPATVRHPLVDTSLLMLIHSVTPPLISTRIITTPRSPSLPLQVPGGVICTFRTSASWNFCLLMR